jgi:hypothetical protein
MDGACQACCQSFIFSVPLRLNAYAPQIMHGRPPYERYLLLVGDLKASGQIPRDQVPSDAENNSAAHDGSSNPREATAEVAHKTQPEVSPASRPESWFDHDPDMPNQRVSRPEDQTASWDSEWAEDSRSEIASKVSRKNLKDRLSLLKCRGRRQIAILTA